MIGMLQEMVDLTNMIENTKGICRDGEYTQYYEILFIGKLENFPVKDRSGKHPIQIGRWLNRFNLKLT